MRTRFGLDSKGFSATERDCTRRVLSAHNLGDAEKSKDFQIHDMTYHEVLSLRITSWPIGGLN